MNERTDSKKGSQPKRRFFYVLGGVLLSSWAIYLFNFYTFYLEINFYIDKRLSLFHQLLSLLKYEWNQSVLYFSLAFILITVTLFIGGVLWLNRKKDGVVISRIYSVIALLLFLGLTINTYGPIFLVLIILSGSLVYVSLIIARGQRHDEANFYEEGEVLETKGPFQTESEANIALMQLVAQWEKSDLLLGEDIYKENENTYYAEIYIEKINQ